MLWDTLDRGLTDSEGIHILPTMRLSVRLQASAVRSRSLYKEPAYSQSLHITVV